MLFFFFVLRTFDDRSQNAKIITRLYFKLHTLPILSRYVRDEHVKIHIVYYMITLLYQRVKNRLISVANIEKHLSFCSHFGNTNLISSKLVLSIMFLNLFGCLPAKLHWFYVLPKPNIYTHCVLKFTTDKNKIIFFWFTTKKNELTSTNVIVFDMIDKWIQKMVEVMTVIWICFFAQSLK